MHTIRSLVVSLLLAPLWAQAPGTPAAPTPPAPPKPDYPSFAEVSKDFEAVPAPEGAFYSVWQRKKDAQLLAELPANFESARQFFALTVPGGELFAGLQHSNHYVYWKRYDKRLALIAPNVGTRSTGDQESKDSVRRIHTDTVLLDLEILCMGPQNQPVIDLDELLLGNMPVFYGASVRRHLATVQKAKVFPKNLEITIEAPDGATLKTFHWSISEIPTASDYKPRAADDRVGYFTTSYRDLGKMRGDEVWQRHINRWHLEKADASLQLSPPKKPILFYLEHTVPVRYRRWVKEGVLAWNQAFAKVGFADAIEVVYQDKATGAHMDKDPEDVRYNFIRWLSNDVGLAIGPSRAHPETGEILDADVVLTDGWIRHFWSQANESLPATAVEGMSVETLRWLDRHPAWDPRVRLSPPAARERLLAAAQKRAELGDVAYHTLCGDGCLLTQPELQHAALHAQGAAKLCLASSAKARGMAFAGMALATAGLLPDTVIAGDKTPAIDGIPEWLVGPLLADLTAHEVGHTLGLRHNFKASSVYRVDQVNSAEWKGKKPFAGSVMDYLPLNVKLDDQGKLQGDVCMTGIGPYDYWAIEYGYTPDDPTKVLARVAEPELAFGTDEDTWGPDPSIRRYDFGADPLAYAANVMELVQKSRAQILDKFVKQGQPWSKARHGYLLTLDEQVKVLGMMADWLGGSFVNRDHKGDPGARPPIVAVPAAQQRAALRFVLDRSMPDGAYGLAPELLAHLAAGRWDEDGSTYEDSTFDVHDRIGGVQSTALSWLLNPTTLRRVYDTELALAASVDVLTLPELLDTVTDEVWRELGLAAADDKARTEVRDASFGKGRVFTPRNPALSSLRRNLQREHLERLIDLSLENGTSSAERSIALLARATLQRLGQALAAIDAKALDAYSRAHLDDARARITKALDATYTYGGGNSGGTTIYWFGKPTEAGK
jgi:hypothetical protein